MIGRVAWAVEGAECCPLSLKSLGVVDRVLTNARVVLVDSYFRAEVQEIFHAADMIGVPVGYKGLRNGGSFGG